MSTIEVTDDIVTADIRKTYSVSMFLLKLAGVCFAVGALAFGVFWTRYIPAEYIVGASIACVMAALVCGLTASLALLSWHAEKYFIRK